MLCPSCFGKGRLPVEIPTFRPPGVVRVAGLTRPCDNPGCIGGYVYCCEAAVNRWENGGDGVAATAEPIGDFGVRSHG